jgi:hypothetical protein
LVENLAYVADRLAPKARCSLHLREVDCSLLLAVTVEVIVILIVILNATLPISLKILSI